MARAQTIPTLDQLTFGGERVTHLYQNDCYFAHLSLYYFALPFACGKIVLDAGSGSGYGANFLAKHGASFVYGADTSLLAVQFCEASFERPNLNFRQMDLERMSVFPERFFDVIFTSNTLEHVSNVQNFLRGAHPVLKPDGVLIVAVPPITNAESKNADLENPYHLNIWSPRQWYYAFGLFFDQVQSYRHYFRRSDIRLDFANSPRQTRITEQDFDFEPVSLADMYHIPTLAALFVIRRPKPANLLPVAGASMLYVDDSYTRPPSNQTDPATGIAAGSATVKIGPSLLQKSIKVLRKRGVRQFLLESYRYLIWHRRP